MMDTHQTHPRRRRRSAAAVLRASLASVALSGCQSGADVPPAAAPSVSAAIVLQRDLVGTQEFSGRLEATERVEIRSRVSGHITKINFKPGARVRKGDLLFVIDPRTYQAQAERADAAARAAVAKVELARIEAGRAARLLADKAIAQREYDERASALREREAEAGVARALLDSARLDLEYTRVSSPIDGRISKEEVTTGNLVDASTMLTSVVSEQGIYASFEGDEDTYLRVARQARQGQSVGVRIGLANEAGFPHRGALEFVDSVVDSGTGSVRMRAVFENAAHALAPGLFARVQLETEPAAGAGQQSLLISDRALGTDQNRKYVIVVGPGGKSEFRQIRVGPVSNGLRVVTHGLEPGEKIVVGGLQRVRPGDIVNARLVAMPDDAPGSAATTRIAAHDKTVPKE